MRREGAWVLGLLVLMLFTISCKREARNFRVEPSAAALLQSVQLSELRAGPGPATNPPVKNDYEENAYALSQGKTLFSQFNCVGCHSHGGGGMGPPLMDREWVYGSNPE